MANPLGDLLEWLFAANITTSDAFASAKALIEANVTRETLQQVIQPALAHQLRATLPTVLPLSAA